MPFMTRGIMNAKDRRCVDMNKLSEVRYWSCVLSISEAQLTELVSKVGNFVQDIRQEMDRAAYVAAYIRY